MWSALFATIALATVPNKSAPATEPRAVSIRMTTAGWSPLVARERTQPSLPAGLGTEPRRVRCTLRVQVDTAGRPTRLEPRACDPEMRKETERAAWQWRFAPHWEDGHPVPTETELRAVIRVR
jgi:hypothetical protein